MAPIIDAHNWTNPADTTEHRFTPEINVPEQWVQRAETNRGRGPGTVTVVNSDTPGWWWF